jgi:putative hydrolase of the HAD superfamily
MSTGELPSNRKYKAVFFDFGDTIAFNNQTFPESMYRILQSIGIKISKDRLKEAILNTDYSEMRKERMKACGKEDYRNFRIKYYRRVLNLLGYPDIDMRYAEFLHNMISFYHSSYLKPEALYVLSTLKAEGFILGIVSNFSHALPRICDELKITDIFDFITYSDSVGYEKPSPQIFEEALEKAGVKPEEVIHVGDSYDADVLGARAVGITPVLLPPSEDDSTNDCICIHNLIDILELLGITHSLNRPESICR